MQSHLQIIGHRGARGLYPENTIHGFLEAVKMGVDAVELDIVVSKDHLLVVSHEAWMNPEFCLAPDGAEIGDDAKENYNLYNMPYAAIATFDCGSRRNPAFPGQSTLRAHKPLLPEVILGIEDLVRKNKFLPLRYHIEIKSEEDLVFNPPPGEFVALFLHELKKHNIIERLIVKSFDVRILQELRKQEPAVKIALLVENPDDLDTNLERLGFVPDTYCPDYVLITSVLVKEAHRRGMRVVPWTVNSAEDFQRMAEAGVDGLITDYPDCALAWRKTQGV